MTKLLPCPFCKEPKPLRLVRAREVRGCDGDCFCCSGISGIAVICSALLNGCGGSGGFKRTEEDAIAAWNRRAGSDD